MSAPKKDRLIQQYKEYEAIAMEILGSYTYHGNDPKDALINNLALIDLLNK